MNQRGGFAIASAPERGVAHDLFSGVEHALRQWRVLPTGSQLWVGRVSSTEWRGQLDVDVVGILE